jgi:hypothetical protein
VAAEAATAEMATSAAKVTAAATSAAPECHGAGGCHCHTESESRDGRNYFPPHRSLSFLYQGRPTMRWAWPSQYRKSTPAFSSHRITNC